MFLNETNISQYIATTFFGLNKLSYITKMLTFAQLKEILKDNKIKGYSHYTKSKLIDLLDKRGLIPENMKLINEYKQRRI